MSSFPCLPCIFNQKSRGAESVVIMLVHMQNLVLVLGLFTAVVT